MVWPDPISLATTLGISLPVGTEMFHFPTFPPHALCVQAWVTGHDSSWVSPFGNPRITVRLPTPRGLSQATTSFFGSWCQGIHRLLLKTCHKNQRCSRPLCSSQATGGSVRTGAYSPLQGNSSSSRNGPTDSTGSSDPAPELQAFARSLRTQQCACLFSSAPSFHAPEGAVLDDTWSKIQLIDVPPLSSTSERVSE